MGTIPSEAFEVSGNTGTPCDGGDSTLVYSFNSGEEAPQSVTLDHAGNVYGPAGMHGGPGFIFEWAKGVLTPLYNFAGGADGGGSTTLVVGPDAALYGSSGGGLQNCNGSYCGEVFELRPPATVCTSALCPWVKTTLYQFTGVDAYGPGNLVFDPAGDLYGITSFDVKGGCQYGWGFGDVFKLTPSDGVWSESTIHRFSGSDGDQPSSLLIGKDGNLYGTTWFGGKYGYGTVFELAPSGTGWTETVLYDFQSVGASPGFLIQDSAGNLFGIFGQELFMLSPSNGGWVFTPLYNVNYDQHGLPFGLAISGGNLTGCHPGTRRLPGSELLEPQLSNYGEIFKLVPGDGGWNYSTLHTFNWWSPDYVTVAPDGYTLWGISWWGGKNCDGAIWRY